MSNLAKNWQKGTYTVHVVGKEVEISTIRSIKKESLFSSCACAKRYVATARCSPEDEFSLSMGVALAMDRLNKQLDKMNDKTIKVGDKVKIKNYGKSYTTYTDWIKENIDDMGLAACYCYGQLPVEGDTVYVVKTIAPWAAKYDKSKIKDLAYVQRYFKFEDDKISTNERCYLIGIDGLEKV